MRHGIKPLLIVEDSDEDFRAVTTGLHRAGVEAEAVYRCTDGDDALDYLHRRGRYEDAPAPRPGVVVLDLNLPGTDGRTVLSEMKNDPELRTIPVIVFTTSTEHRDIQGCYDAGVNAYVQKPMELKQFLNTIGVVAEHWCRVVQLPKE